ncbi:MAG: phosphatidate cytidylyltransferase [Paraprevotella sp.]|nr:phosphatidate cytidylyltransferase [Paraprevotella sp.]
MTEKIKNLLLRTITGVIFVAVMAGCILLGNIPFTLLFAVITGLSVWEFCRVVNRREDVEVNGVICTVVGVYLFLAMSGFCSNITPSGVFMPYLLSVVYLMISELYLKSPHALNNWAFTMMSQMYVALPFALLNVLAFQPDAASSIGVVYNTMLPLSVFIFLWVSDSGAYCFGTLLGRHKLFPRISPHKSWEGSIGGGIVALAVSQIFARFEQLLSPMEWLGLAFVVVLFGTWGDLVESLFKRQLQIKDSGSFLPGHGGMLDRFDSSLMAIPAAVIYLYTRMLL